jgi:hypothetical protein
MAYRLIQRAWRLYYAFILEDAFSDAEISKVMKGLDETLISLYSVFSAGDENVQYSEIYGKAFGRRSGEGAPKLP